MDATDWEPLKQLFERASALPAEEQAAFLDSACADDPAKQAQLTSLLAAAQDAQGFFDSLADALISLAPWSDDARAEETTEPPRHDPLIGRTVQHYRIEAKLGSGGMGVVYRASDLSLNREVALKFLPRHMTGDEAATERFLVEAQAAAALDHPNICNVHEIGETDDGRRFIVMSYYEGETLKQKLERGPLPIDEACDYARQIAAALGAAHAHDIIHRDIKPGNVIVTPDGLAKVLDFGLAKLTDVTLTGTGTTLGTVAYMSPEQIQGNEVDHHTDLWSLGVLLYEMVTGERPFRGDSTAIVFHAIQYEDPEPPSAYRSGLSPGIDRVMTGALAKVPGERFATAQEMATALEGASGYSSPAVHDPGQGALDRFKERKLVQWALAYVAGAWVVTQLTEVLATPLRLSVPLQQGVLVTLVIGFFITLILAWYHGEKGRHRVRGPELLMVAALLVIAGGVLSILPEADERAETASTALAPASADDRPAIAVLPFEDLSTDSTFAYFAKAMQEQITSTLSDISALRVVSRSSVMQYAEDRPGSRQMAQELGVTHLVEGSAQVSGGQVRLTVQLIDAIRDEHVWSDEYDRELTAENLFVVRSEVGRQIAYQVGATLTPEERHQAARVLTESTDCYLTYLRGKEEFLGERQIGAMLWQDYESRRLFDLAIELDPGFAPAHAQLALTLTYTAPDEGRYERAREEAERALALMPGLGEARVALGRYYIRVGRPREAMSHLSVAVDENPNLSLAVVQMAGLQWDLGEFEAALETLERAVALDPRNPRAIGPLSAAYRYAHRYDESLELLGRQEELYPTSSMVHARVYLHLLAGEMDRARAAIEELISDYPERPYQQIPGTPRTVVRRVLTEEQRRVAFESYLQFETPCADRGQFCLSKAIHEEEVGSRASARIYFDSLAIVLERNPPGNRRELLYAIVIYQGLGRKDEALAAADALIDMKGASSEGGTPSAPALHEDRILLARILAHFGEADRAIDILEEELPIPSELAVPVLEIDPVWDPLRSHPRFQALLEEYRDAVGP